MIHSREIKQRIVSEWLYRSDNRHRQNDTEQFTDEVWDSGLRLAKSKELHYQHVMDLIRSLIKHSE